MTVINTINAMSITNEITTAIESVRNCDVGSALGRRSIVELEGNMIRNEIDATSEGSSSSREVSSVELSAMSRLDRTVAQFSWNMEYVMFYFKFINIKSDVYNIEFIFRVSIDNFSQNLAPYISTPFLIGGCHF